MMWCLSLVWMLLQQPSIQALRENYSAIVNDEKQCTTYLNYFNQLPHPTATEKAFRAALLASSAQFTMNPYTKLNLVKNAQRLFDEAVAADRENPEIRYLRLSIEQYTPRILGMSDHIREDKNLLVQQFQVYVSLAGKESASQVIKFLKYHKLCSDAELSNLEKWIP